MLILPIPGDKVEVKSGTQYTVLSYSNYGKEGPAVFVESPDKTAKPSSILFSVITGINGSPVQLTAQKIFKLNGRIKRSVQLPQPGDFIKSQGTQFQVLSLKLAVRANLAKGLLLVCEDVNTKKKQDIPASEIESLEHANGSDLFSVSQFKKLYKDYLNK